MPSRLRLVSFLLDTGPRSLSHGPIPLSLSARHLTTYPHPFVSTPTHLSGSSFRLAGLRCYATHKSTTPPEGRNSTDDLLHRLEDASRSKAARDALGPSGRRKAWRRWRELGLGGKRESTRCRRRRRDARGGLGSAVMAARTGSDLSLQKDSGHSEEEGGRASWRRACFVAQDQDQDQDWVRTREGGRHGWPYPVPVVRLMTRA
jgi:hypothetical protein